MAECARCAGLAHEARHPAAPTLASRRPSCGSRVLYRVTTGTVKRQLLVPDMEGLPPVLRHLVPEGAFRRSL